MRKTKTVRKGKTSGPTFVPSQAVTTPSGTETEDQVKDHSSTTDIPIVEKRKPSNEVADLTSKNYRLAKELAELRLRHRDETKTVTRLTMENMNLASRCREAISHVAMLKKELSMHQRRSAELLALQRQASPVSSGAIDEFNFNRTAPGEKAAEQEDIFDHLSNKGRSQQYMPNGRASQNMENVSDGKTRISSFDIQQDFMFSSDKAEKSKKKNLSNNTSGFEKESNQDIEDSFRDINSANLFSSYKHSLPVTPERENVEDTTPSLRAVRGTDKNDRSSRNVSAGEVSLRREESHLKPSPFTGVANSFNSFEATFDSTFHNFFTDGISQSTDVAFDTPEFPDPFFQDNVRVPVRGRDIAKARTSRSTSPLKSTKNGNKAIPVSKDVLITQKSLSSVDMETDSMREFDLFPESAMEGFENLSMKDSSNVSEQQDILFESEEKRIKSAKIAELDEMMEQIPVDDDNNNLGARARYDATDGERQKELASHLVLRRLQQRKVKDNNQSQSNDNTTYSLPESNFSSTNDLDERGPLQYSSDVSKRSVGSRSSNNIKKQGTKVKSISDEMKKLDDIASSVSIPDEMSSENVITPKISAIPKRRNVQQPISYAEPNISSKLRRGDVYFPKKGKNVDSSGAASNSASTKESFSDEDMNNDCDSLSW
eukprot:CAMPEP_0184863208 /NCGR_PEP_ID=MMETSP0580-20130426/9784_1 /TAXON_ID=1118495 /ORGANISM="Dactyliosolen fragilissimus" /LENGTH=657 /DNA_ID=CAMNT_0027361399 /DNA_START=96 /DNA_END=2066 /DNA_ORIENTATION=-